MNPVYIVRRSFRAAGAPNGLWLAGTRIFPDSIRYFKARLADKDIIPLHEGADIVNLANIEFIMSRGGIIDPQIIEFLMDTSPNVFNEKFFIFPKVESEVITPVVEEPVKPVKPVKPIKALVKPPAKTE